MQGKFKQCKTWDEYLLEYAAENNFPMVKQAIINGANINSLNHWSCNILMYAVINENFEMVKYLISKGIDVNIKAYVFLSLLSVALTRENYEIAEFLLDRGVKASTVDLLKFSFFFERRSARRRSAFACALYLRKLLGRDCANKIAFLIWMDRK